MKSIKTEGKTGRELYPLLTSSVIPRPIAWVSTLAEEGHINLAPFSYFNLVSSRPPILMVSVGARDGVPKDTAINILREKNFVVHLVSEPWLEAMNQTAADVESNVSEVEMTGLTPVDSTLIQTPGIKEARVRLECAYDQHIDYPHSTIIFGHIKMIHIDDDVLDGSLVDPEKLAPIGRLGRNDYTTLGRVIHLPRPTKETR